MADRIVWTSGDGATSIDLTDEAAGFRVLADGTRGLRNVTYEFATSTYAGIDGANVNSLRAGPSQPTLGLMMQADGELDLRNKVRGLVRAMRPRIAGAISPGSLAVSSPDGETRTLFCYCTDGLTGDEARDVTLVGAWWKAVLTFFAPDPWWYGDTQTVSVGLGAGSAFFPIPPVSLAPSSVQGQFVIDLSDADALSYPTWVIDGPGSSLTLTNETTGRVIQVDTSFDVGESIVIDTRPGYQSVRLSDGTNLMGQVSSDPALWPLVEGLNTVTAALTGATSTSRITGTYQPRFAGI